MSIPVSSLLTRIIIQPETALALELTEWDLLIRQARRSNVLAKLAYLLEDLQLIDNVPEHPRRHLLSTQVHAQRFSISLDWEIECINQALTDLQVPVVFLKGTAYHVAENQAGRGRVFSDVDILVPEAMIADVEIALVKAGWMTSTFAAYDQKYYREWMHEIPPLRHLKRQTSIDVHHNILPKTCRFCPDASKLLAQAVKIPGTEHWVLSPEDRVLHSAAHLFYGGEFDQGFRDLTDLHFLLKEFAETDGFWPRLQERATKLNQQIALHYALRYTRLILQTSMPDSMFHEGQAGIKQRWMDALFLRALQPNHVSCNGKWTGLACWLLFVRSHWLKMPWYLLLPHLFRKTRMKFAGESQH